MDRKDVDESIMESLQEAMFALAALFSMRVYSPGLSWRECLDTMLKNVQHIRQRARELAPHEINDLERSLQNKMPDDNTDMMVLMLALMNALLRYAECGKAQAKVDALLDKVLVPVGCPENDDCPGEAGDGGPGYDVCRQCWLEWLERETQGKSGERGNG